MFNSQVRKVVLKSIFYKYEVCLAGQLKTAVFRGTIYCIIDLYVQHIFYVLNLEKQRSNYTIELQ